MARRKRLLPLAPMLTPRRSYCSASDTSTSQPSSSSSDSRRMRMVGDGLLLRALSTSCETTASTRSRPIMSRLRVMTLPGTSSTGRPSAPSVPMLMRRAPDGRETDGLLPLPSRPPNMAVVLAANFILPQRFRATRPGSRKWITAATLRRDGALSTTPVFSAWDDPLSTRMPRVFASWTTFSRPGSSMSRGFARSSMLGSMSASLRKAPSPVSKFPSCSRSKNHAPPASLSSASAKLGFSTSTEFFARRMARMSLGRGTNRADSAGKSA
mmetsp:Transcript_35380/g.111317  ORF Transcript_35380/g.111317 Transcript_35380/m.111317 type:complete len:269 (-) Transcript_35380:3222-4028(-)